MRIVQLPIWNVRFAVRPREKEGRFWWFNVLVAARNSAEAMTIALERDDVTRIYDDKVFSEVESVTKTPDLILIDADNVGEEE